MSLLLEALKKAEKAKEEAQRRAKGDSAPAPAASPLELQPAAAEARGEQKPVLTRAELPDMSRPPEILTEDLAPKPRPAAPPARPGPVPAARSQPRVQPAGREPGKDSAPEERAAAKKVFEAKFKEPNP